MAIANLCDHIYQGREDRGREYKGPMVWTDILTKAKITRTILAMSNIRDGGVIVIGMKEKTNGQYEPAGLSDSDATTFNHDDIATHVREYADPYVYFTVTPVRCNGKKFVVIQVEEFDEVPVICKKDGKDLRRGAIYTRSRTKNESAEVQSQSEMREILDIASEKKAKYLMSTLLRLGVVGLLAPENGKDRFAKQREDLP